MVAAAHWHLRLALASRGQHLRLVLGVCFGCPAAVYKCVASPPVGWHGIVSVNEEKPRKLPHLECHPLSSMRVKIELLTYVVRLGQRDCSQA